VKTWSTPVRAGNDAEKIPCALCGGLSFKPALECESFSYVRCTRCGLVQMNPQPVKSEVLSRYGSDFGEDYLNYELKNEDAFLKLQQLALGDAGFAGYEKALVSPSVLDVGCATGALINYLRDRGWSVTGVEISPCAQYAQKERTLDVRTVPLEENNFPPECFDTVLASHLIEHLNDPFSFLKEVNRILKKDGRFFITTPNISGMQARLFRGRWRSAIFDHLYLFSIRTLSKMLKKAGFQIEKTATWGGLAVGFAPVPIKKIADTLAKPLHFGDVMIIRAKKGIGSRE
jgi:2-polyprenyl-3-methyl-5-hydroxy-6-metoxy-1,4-benzoquinol methylase